MRYDLPIPYGWYCVGHTKDLANGDVKALKYFGRDLVMFRNEEGAVGVLDAFCPHLGAHLGHGGTVDGTNIACPFHGWQFNTDGHCDKVPYASQVPPKAKDKQTIHSYPVSELHGMIWAWYHPRDIAPLWEVEAVEELDSDDWSDIEIHDWTINTILQETGENAVDTAHFMYVHLSTTLPAGDVTVEGHRRVTDIKMQTAALSEFNDGEESQGHLISKSIGPGQTVQHYDAFFKTIMVGTITPIDDQSLHLRFHFSQPSTASDDQKVIADGVRAMMVEQVEEDIPIWEHKKYEPNPILCDGDGPINKYRKWFRQFYDELNQVDSSAA